MADWSRVEAEILDASQELNKLNIFLYGLPGTGKTTFLGSVAEHMPTLVIKAEEGALSISGSKAKVVKLERPGADPRDRMRALLQYLQSPEGQSAFSAVCLDTLSAYQASIAAHLKARSKRALQLQDWGEVVEATNAVLVALTNLNQTIVVTCHSQEIEDADNGVLVRPSLSGKKLPNSATALFDVSAYTTRVAKEDGTSRYVCLTSHPSEKYVVKDRTGKLERVEASDFGVWKGKIYG